ncbi:complex I 24 kDa subunit family protein [Culicoidibacter larvae]|uniref:NAD(P)H-dependent oxidoreductase subunit E n=1 Tax=Culicoidibacter larvae TaxID=2579976 RepID=A0A5R8QB90_9FIRM|nr:NAD(P)H-dependent oxidoreductase subunit E [Culicoidibacter larvae]TLG73782.1 NAD(P)H-dependent oxidoreductase subunit E [Culicoidibacter larvae]
MSCNCSQGSENKELFNELGEFISSLPEQNESSLIQVLHRAQHIFGYLPREVQTYVAQKLNIPVARVYGVVSFYSYFTDTPRGEYVVQVCMGTGCFVKGSGKVLEAFEKSLNLKSGETSDDLKFTLSGVRCVGACGLAPVVIINEKVYGHVQSEDVESIIENHLVETLS